MSDKINLGKFASWCASNLNPEILLIGRDSKYFSRNLRDEFGSRAIITFFEHANDKPTTKSRFDLIIFHSNTQDHFFFGISENQTSTEEKLNAISDLLKAKGSILILLNKKSEILELIVKSMGLHFVCIPLKSETILQYQFIYCILKNEPNGLLANHHFLQAACYDGYASDYEEDVEFLSKWLGNASEVLEIGIGSGRLALKLSKFRKCYFGIDHSAAMLHQLLKKKMTLPIQVMQLNMCNFNLRKKFDCVFFPFRVLPYAGNNENLIAALRCAKNHLKRNGRILINMLDFSENFINKWNNQSVSYDFKGPDGEIWNKTDVMIFENGIMYRRVQIRTNGILISENEDNLIWMNAETLSALVEKVGLKVTNIWPAYEWKQYIGKDEYVLEARRRA
jgi:SAM-dependent methyltransferase